MAESKIEELIEELKIKKIEVIPWEDLAKEYDPDLHSIVEDTTTRIDRDLESGGVEKAARLTYARQKLAVNQIAQLAFTVPVKRVYSINNAKQKLQSEAIEAVYKKARIDALNIKRFKAYFGACEVSTIWFVEEKENTFYGFESKFALKCLNYSPMDRKFSRIEQALIFPIFDEHANLITLSFEYEEEENIDGEDVTVTYFETYDEVSHRVYRAIDGEWEPSPTTKPITIKKIPGIYINRPLPIWEDISRNVSEIEYAHSRNSDILRRNSAPVMKITGEFLNPGDRPEGDQAREVFQLSDGGDIDYVKPPLNHEATESHIRMVKSMIDEELQMPDLSVENVKSFGASGTAREHLLTNAHLKIGDESGDLLEFLDRECSVIKSFIADMNPQWNDIFDLDVEHEITPFVMQDDAKTVNTLVAATQKPIMSQKTAVQRAGFAVDADKEVELMRQDSLALMQNQNNANEKEEGEGDDQDDQDEGQSRKARVKESRSEQEFTRKNVIEP